MRTFRCTLAGRTSTRSSTCPARYAKHIPTRENGWAGDNTARSCIPGYDEVYEELAQTGAGPERAALIIS